MVRWFNVAVLMTVLMAGPLRLSAQQISNALESVVITAPAVSLETPAVLIDAPALEQRRASTLGETLRGVAGVSATGYGVNSSRPIVRGQDGDRVSLFQNSVPAQDVSAMSFDHAVGVNPYALERVEILRGPSALTYGSNVQGGVINLIDRRILREPVNGATAITDLRFDSANNARQIAAEFEAGRGQGLHWHADVVDSSAGETRTPKFTDPDGITGRKIRNSSATSRGAGVGVSHIHGSGFWGLSLENFQSEYGVPKETGTRIDLNRNQLTTGGEERFSGEMFEKFRLWLGATDYSHREIESGAVGQTFKTQGGSLRLEILNRPWSGWKGVMGLQWNLVDLKTSMADVTETSLMPNVRSHNTGFFVLQERAVGQGVMRLAARAEDAQARAATTNQVVAWNPGSVSTSGAAQSKRFNPVSVSAQYEYLFTPQTRGALSLSHAERAPSNFELFAAGVHKPTGTFEMGNPALSNERANHLDYTLTHRQDGHQFRGSVFASRYSNYITLIRRGSGNTSYVDGTTSYPVYDYSGVAATFHGAELEYRARIRLSEWQVSPGVVADEVIGKRSSNNANIVRLPPRRYTGFLEWTRDQWMLRPELQIANAARLGENETNHVGGYTVLNFQAQYRQSNQIWFLKAANLTNRLAYWSTTVDEVRRYTPQAGRSLQLGVKIMF